MHSYKAPLRDLRFLMDEVLDFPAHYAALPSGPQFGSEEVDAVLQAVAKFAEDVLAPLNVPGDGEGAHFEAGNVRAPRGFADAYRQYVDAGWPRLGNPAEHGGETAPYSLKLVVSEFMQAANQSWCMYALLNDGAIKTLMSFADRALIERFVPKLVSGEWLATMCLTEPQCGSDLNLVRCRAEPRGDGSYAITGTKIFISSGEQDFSENIVHLVLARLPAAAAGTRGISLFVVPKRLHDSQLNSVRCLSIEHKMGLKASATCVMAFEGAQGWLVGEPGRGLNAMFVFINKSRLGTAQQAHAQAEAVFQSALAYAHERRAGRSPDGRGPVALVAHPDIRRMLLTQKAIAEGGRALVLYCAKWADRGDEPRLAFLTPIAKGVLSEWASEAADLGIQILGGHGYMKEWGIEQRVRDVRITRIYEGTTGIQAMDLLGRKLPGPGRAELIEFTNEIVECCKRAATVPVLQAMSTSLMSGVRLWLDVSSFAEERSQSDPDFVGAVAVDYLLLSGYVSVGYMLVMSADAAHSRLERTTGDQSFYRAKLHTVQFYFDKLLPRIYAHAQGVHSGSASLNMQEL
jgi:alkylation response protein AidB-like acyl-CoA dehydrogenase